MENASEALMMAFGVLIFVLALTVAITSFSQAREASDTMLYWVDETNYYDYIEIDEGSAVASQSRIVRLETVIPTLYKYFKENYTVLFRETTVDNNTGEIVLKNPKTIYETQRENKAVWGSGANGYTNYVNLINIKYSKYFKNFNFGDSNYKNIFSFDLDEELLRHEPWVGNDEETKKHLDAFVNGGSYEYSDSSGKNKEYKYNKGLIENYRDKSFIETIGEYSYNSTQSTDTDDESSISGLVKPKKKRIIIYTIIKN